VSAYSVAVGWVGPRRAIALPSPPIIAQGAIPDTSWPYLQDGSINRTGHWRDYGCSIPCLAVRQQYRLQLFPGHGDTYYLYALCVVELDTDSCFVHIVIADSERERVRSAIYGMGSIAFDNRHLGA